MRVLLDENLPHDLISELVGHDVVTVQGLGWAGVKNGDLLRRASGQVAAFVTMDRKLEREHDYRESRSISRMTAAQGFLSVLCELCV